MTAIVIVQHIFGKQNVAGFTLDNGFDFGMYLLNMVMYKLVSWEYSWKQNIFI